MKRGRVRVSWELFLQHFPFPDGTQLIGASMNYGDIELIVTHETLKDGAEGEILDANPTFRKQDPVVFVNWGQG